MSEKKDLVDQIFEACLICLVELKFVSSNDFEDKGIYSRCDMNDKLENLQFFAGSSIDDIGRPVLVFNIDQNIKALAWAIAHEAVHIAQICKGDWEPFQGYSTWKGEKFDNLEADDPNYSSNAHQPWEFEAKEMEGKVWERLCIKLPALVNL